MDQNITTGLMTLPPELRRMVYQHLLVAPPTPKGERDYLAPDPRGLQGIFEDVKSEWSPDLAILRTSRAIYEEASEVFYGENNFWFSEECYPYFFEPVSYAQVMPCNLVQIGIFLKMIGPRNVAKLRTLCISLETDCFILHRNRYGLAPGKKFPKVLTEAFRELARHNNLRELEIEFIGEGSREVRDTFGLMLDERRNLELRDAFLKMRVKKLTIGPDCTNTEWYMDVLETVQERPPLKQSLRVWK